jgi:protein-S-isoprenylcysteine O-methyltransferase Ste14
MKKPGCRHQSRFVLSATDLALLIVMAALITAHLKAALAGSLVSLLFIAQHLAILVLTLLHRPAGVACRSYGAILLAWAGTLLPLAMRPTAEPATRAGLILLIPGSLLATAAILSLGRSFGMEPAHRGLRTRWLYRVVRHPIYAAYLLIIGGVLLSAWSWWNSVVAIIWLAVQVLRIIREEAVLAGDDAYRRYAQQVRWRLVPGLW